MSKRQPPARSAEEGRETGEHLSPDAIRNLCELLYRRTGMIFGESKRYYIERRVADRMSATGMRTFPTYFSHVQASETEIESLINIFTVNETYFYREENQLQCLGRSLLPNIVRDRKPGDLVRIWSVPCSTGEEPYSIAIWLLENWLMVDAYHIEIVGSDIDTCALQMAVAGDYRERALSRLPPDVIERYFESPYNNSRRIIQDIRESVTFTSVNLVDRASVTTQGRFDIVFCRNVLIYFDDASRLLAANHLYDALNPGGYICLGHTESMSRISNRFRLCRFEDAIVYQPREEDR
ncbi:CheR family methyltransferase [Microvirga lotononidis]|uniref:protein-glutamate O-methyltransferase n=1 Tax=Microvirga lotononidis TaxID=864069 RepID=I4YYB6_9HYPH|nr:protein-glutamate O-methyltransferase CheR [Microvirga lotononidis]EIM28958.1 methylase of chemotaxis methyl-accepting protein [Microvirga lotononidis]WQO26876.1 protein-glutamate O-methyltransferase CheR [Microvirga lotononidis]